MAGVIECSRLSAGAHPKALKESIGAFALALDKGKAEGKVSDRLVRATFAAIERVTPQLRIDHMPNPFPGPHNLSWYFSACACPDEIRNFATRLGGGHFRVWSVAQDSDGWKILAQVFGASSQAEAQATMEQEARVPSLALKRYVMAGANSFSMASGDVDGLMTSQGKALLAKQGKGHFVEIALDRRYG